MCLCATSYQLVPERSNRTSSICCHLVCRVPLVSSGALPLPLTLPSTFVKNTDRALPFSCMHSFLAAKPSTWMSVSSTECRGNCYISLSTGVSVSQGLGYSSRERLAKSLSCPACHAQINPWSLSLKYSPEGVPVEGTCDQQCCKETKVPNRLEPASQTVAIKFSPHYLGLPHHMPVCERVCVGSCVLGGGWNGERWGIGSVTVALCRHLQTEGPGHPVTLSGPLHRKGWIVML